MKSTKTRSSTSRILWGVTGTVHRALHNHPGIINSPNPRAEMAKTLGYRTIGSALLS